MYKSVLQERNSAIMRMGISIYIECSYKEKLTNGGKWLYQLGGWVEGDGDFRILLSSYSKGKAEPTP